MNELAPLRCQCLLIANLTTISRVLFHMRRSCGSVVTLAETGFEDNGLSMQRIFLSGLERSTIQCE